ncbi:hypothetical protein DID88_007533 [Monilinia fructigena]|uniref:Uncharacterized protein n=1 Tax=Monilinia fructigena TaxID=38457 RepID=A0A395J2N7_9HELO|nr:hypothetical protein DID88_007533 [Monilinia fructigena]
MTRLFDIPLFIADHYKSEFLGWDDPQSLIQIPLFFPSLIVHCPSTLVLPNINTSNSFNPLCDCQYSFGNHSRRYFPFLFSSPFVKKIY